MKIGDLVKYKRDTDYKPGPCFGLIIDFTHMFNSGGGGAWPSSETYAIVSWSSDTEEWVTNEREEDLEVIK